MLTASAFICLLTVVLLVVSRGAVRPFHLTFAALSVIVIGYARLAHQGGETGLYLDLYLAAMIALVIGYLVGQLISPASAGTTAVVPDWVGGTAAAEISTTSDAPPLRNGAPGEPAVTAARADLAALKFTAGIIAALGAYHFLRVGIPLLSPTPELDRWNFTGSGLMGLPGRAQLFGSVIVVAISYAATRGADRRTAIRAVAIPLAALFAFRVSGGFKGGLLQFVVQVAFVQFALRPPLNLGRAIRRYGAWLAVAVFFAAGVASLYQTASERDSEGLALVFDRATLVPAREGTVMLELADSGARIMPADTMISDFEATIRDYLPGLNGGEDRFLRIFSAHINGRSLIGDRFIVPVTPQGFPVLYYNHGMRAWALMFAFGALYGMLESVARVSRSVPGATAAVIGCLVLHYFLLKGDLAFVAVNWGAMLALTLGCFWLLRTSLTRERPTNAVALVAMPSTPGRRSRVPP